MNFRVFIESYVFFHKDERSNLHVLRKEELTDPPKPYLLILNRKVNYWRNNEAKQMLCVWLDELDDIYQSDEYVVINVVLWKIEQQRIHLGLTEFSGMLSKLESMKGQKLEGKPKIKYKDFKDIPNFMYHGTDLETYENVIKKQGLIGQENDPTKQTFLSIYSSSSGTYVADSPEHAEQFAEIRAKTKGVNRAVVLKIDIRPYKSKMFADEDSQRKREEILKSLNNIGTAYITGKINPLHITLHSVSNVIVSKQKKELSGFVESIYNVLKDVVNIEDQIRIIYVLYGQLCLFGQFGQTSKVFSEMIESYQHYVLRRLRNIKKHEVESFLGGMKVRLNSSKRICYKEDCVSPKNINIELKMKILSVIDRLKNQAV